MNKEELIALGIEEDVAKQVMALHGKTVTQLNAEIATIKGERDSAQNELTSNKEEFDKLKEEAKGNEDLTQKLADLQAQYDQNKEDSEKQLAEQKKNYSIRLALKEAKPLDEDIVFSQLDADTIKVTDDGLTGLNEQLAALKEKKAFLFETETDPDPNPNQNKPGRVTFPGNANPPSGGGNNDPFANVLAKYKK